MMIDALFPAWGEGCPVSNLCSSDETQRSSSSVSCHAKSPKEISPDGVAAACGITPERSGSGVADVQRMFGGGLWLHLRLLD